MGGIRVAQGTVTRICDAGDSFAIQVQNASDLNAAIAAARLARVDLLGLASHASMAGGGEQAPTAPAERASVSPVVNVPGGPLLLVEHLDADYHLLRTIPDVVRHRLEQAGVQKATIASPEPGGVLDDLDHIAHAVVLRLFPPPAGPATVLPPDWIDVACEWVVGDLRDLDVVRLRILTVEFDVPAPEVSAVVHECGLARAWCDAVNGDIHDRIRTASLTYGRLPHLVLGAGGPGADNAGLEARFELLREVARELGPAVAYACLDFEDTFEGLALGLGTEGWRRQGGANPNFVAANVVDEVVPDAFPYQILGPAHVARLGGSAQAPPLEPLGDGRVEVALGHPHEWLTTVITRDDAVEEGLALLSPLLVSDDEARRLAARRPPPGTAPARGSAAGAEVDAGLVLDLDDIVLESAPHSRRGTRLTLLELVSWLNNEPHRDTPACVPDALASFVRWWAAGLDDDDRQRLKPVAPSLIGADPGERTEHARRWAAAEWLVRQQAPAWLRLAGLVEPAEHLEALGPLTADVELVRAVDVLGSAITVASRRIGITISIVDDDDLGDVSDDHLAWEAWERISESTAWVAASETATQGAPHDLIYATDQRVIECSRDRRIREENEAQHITLANAAWSTALHEVAADAWEKGWRAADRLARELTGMTIRMELGRIAKEMERRPGREDDHAEPALDLAERAARFALSRAVVGSLPTEGVHPWDAADQAARLSSGGAVWAAVNDEARRTVSPEVWNRAMAEARTAVAAMLADAPDLVGRVVAASVAREACSAAARGVALRSAAVARAEGGGDDDAEAAAVASLSETAARLKEHAFALLDRLIDPH